MGANPYFITNGETKMKEIITMVKGNIDDIAQILILRTPAQNSYKTQPITA